MEAVGAGYGGGMTTGGFETIRGARARHREMYGEPEQAREHAADLGAAFCEDCWAMYFALPGYARDGHQCLTDGTTDAYRLGE